MGRGAAGKGAPPAPAERVAQPDPQRPPPKGSMVETLKSHPRTRTWDPLSGWGGGASRDSRVKDYGVPPTRAGESRGKPSYLHAPPSPPGESLLRPSSSSSSSSSSRRQADGWEISRERRSSREREAPAARGGASVPDQRENLVCSSSPLFFSFLPPLPPYRSRCFGGSEPSTIERREGEAELTGRSLGQAASQIVCLLGFFFLPLCWGEPCLAMPSW